jgi:hypothetical protein
MASFVTFTLRHPTDLVSKDYYKQEVDYQSHMDNARRADADPGSASLHLDAATRVCEIEFPAAGVEGNVTLYRPADAALDRTVPIALDINRRQQIDLASLAPGLWRVRLQWTRGAEEYFKEKAIHLN